MSKAARAVVRLVFALFLGVIAVAARGQQPVPRPDLTNPAAFKEQAPDMFESRFEATFGTFVIRVTRAWAPNGADRFYNLVKAGFYNENRFYRVVKDSLVQWGIHGDPAVSAAWAKAMIPADRARMSNTRGRVTFGLMGSPDTRSTEVFINFKDNSKLDLEGFAAFGQVVTSMVMVQLVFDQYGEINPLPIYAEGNALLIKKAPQLDYIKSATILPPQ